MRTSLSAKEPVLADRWKLVAVVPCEATNGPNDEAQQIDGDSLPGHTGAACMQSRPAVWQRDARSMLPETPWWPMASHMWSCLKLCPSSIGAPMLDQISTTSHRAILGSPRGLERSKCELSKRAALMTSGSLKLPAAAGLVAVNHCNSLRIPSVMFYLLSKRQRTPQQQRQAIQKHKGRPCNVKHSRWEV